MLNMQIYYKTCHLGFRPARIPATSFRQAGSSDTDMHHIVLTQAFLPCISVSDERHR